MPHLSNDPFLSSRALSRSEAAQLLGLGPRYFECRKVTPDQAAELDRLLNNGPHDLVKWKMFLPDNQGRKWADCRVGSIGYSVQYLDETWLTYGSMPGQEPLVAPIDLKRRYRVWLIKMPGSKLVLRPFRLDLFLPEYRE